MPRKPIPALSLPMLAILSALSLAGCGDATARRDAATAMLAKGLGGEVTAGSVSKDEGGLYTVSDVTWKGPIAGRAASAEVTRSGPGAPVLVALRGVILDGGGAAAIMTVEPGTAGRHTYRLTDARLSGLGVTAEAGHAVVDADTEGTARVSVSELRLAAGSDASPLVGAVLGRWPKAGTLSGEGHLMRRGGTLRVDLVRLGPSGGSEDALALRTELEAPEAKPLLALVPSDLRLSYGSMTLGPLAGPPERVAEMPDIVPDIASGRSVAVRLGQSDTIPLAGLAAALPALAQRGSLAVGPDLRNPRRPEVPAAAPGPQGVPTTR